MSSLMEAMMQTHLRTEAARRATAATRGSGSYYRPLNPSADERAQETGEDTMCANCHASFMFHNNGECPKK